MSAVMPTKSIAPNTERTYKLLREAYALTDDLSTMDKKTERDLNAHKSRLAKWIDENVGTVELTPAGKFAVNQAKDKAKEWPVQQIFKAIFKLLSISVKAAELPASIVVSVFSADEDKAPNKQQAYFDDHPQMASEYQTKKDRLSRIYTELFIASPPTVMDLQKNVCDVEACWQSR
jgi:hypothetical protein